MKTKSPEARLDGFIAKYSPEVGDLAHDVLSKLRDLLPGAIEMVYDNYNALVIGFGATEKASNAILSIALYPRWVNMYLMNGPNLPDPKKLLRGDGNMVRWIRLEDAADLDKPAVRALIEAARKRAKPPLNPANERRMVIKLVSAKQRPRRPAM